jgi:hypothetical protein
LGDLRKVFKKDKATKRSNIFQDGDVHEDEEKIAWQMVAELFERIGRTLADEPGLLDEAEAVYELMRIDRIMYTLNR